MLLKYSSIPTGKTGIALCAHVCACICPTQAWPPHTALLTQSLAGVTPPDVSYVHHLSAEVKAKKLSNAQLETVLYSMMRFNQELPSGRARKGPVLVGMCQVAQPLPIYQQASQ